MLHAYAVRFDMIRNLEKFWIFLETKQSYILCGSQEGSAGPPPLLVPSPSKCGLMWLEESKGIFRITGQEEPFDDPWSWKPYSLLRVVSTTSTTVSIC